MRSRKYAAVSLPAVPLRSSAKPHGVRGTYHNAHEMKDGGNSMTKIQFAACSAVLCFLLPLMAYGAEDVNLKGIITGRTGDSMTLKTPDAGTVTVVGLNYRMRTVV
jgi:hypothetical protein